MKIYSKNIINSSYKSILEFFTLSIEGALYIDIETTGFSRSNDIIYLIGLLYNDNGNLILTQYLCEKQADEYELLFKLNQQLENFKTLIHFNGDSFDLPFIKERMALYRLHSRIDQLESFDFLKALRPLKKVLRTDNFKLKTMEKLAGYNRIDPFTGGELIQLYHLYTKGDEKLEPTFILHNEEDMIGLYYLNHFLPLIQLTNPSCAINLKSLVWQANPSSFSTSYSYPQQVSSFDFSFHREDFYVELNNNGLVIDFPIYTGELKTFFDDYGNYYYLTNEDYAIHKSLADFVSSKYKKKANRKTAYVKKMDQFVKCPWSKKELLSMMEIETNVYIFNENLDDSFCYLLTSDFITYLPFLFKSAFTRLILH